MRPLILTAAFVALGLTASAQAATSSPASLAMASGSPVTLTTLSPAKKSGPTISLPASAPTRTGDAEIVLRGSLRVGVGVHRATLTSLRLEFGLVGASITAKLGAKRIAAFEIKAARGKPLRVDGRAGTVRVDHAAVTLAPAAGSRLKSALKLRAAPSSSRSVGTLTLIVAAKATKKVTPVVTGSTDPIVQKQTQPLPQTGTIVDNGTGDSPPSGDSTPPPGSGDPPPADGGPQAPTCATDPVVGTTSWKASGLPGSSDLKSWINYIYDFGGAVYTYCDAARIDPANPWDYSLPVVSVVKNVGDGTVTITHRGRISYFMTEHGIDMYVENPVITVSADRASATVTATMQSQNRDHPDDPPVVATFVVMTIDLSAATTSTAGGGDDVHRRPGRPDRGRRGRVGL